MRKKHSQTVTENFMFFRLELVRTWLRQVSHRKVIIYVSCEFFPFLFFLHVAPCWLRMDDQKKGENERKISVFLGAMLVAFTVLVCGLNAVNVSFVRHGYVLLVSQFRFDRGTNNKNKQSFPRLEEGRMCWSSRSPRPQRPRVNDACLRTQYRRRAWCDASGLCNYNSNIPSFFFNRYEGLMRIVCCNETRPRLYYLIAHSKYPSCKPWSCQIT